MKIVGSIGQWRVAGAVVALCVTAGPCLAEVAPPAVPFGGASCAADGASGLLPARVVNNVGNAGQSRSNVRPAAQVTRNEKADVTFEVRPSAGGGVAVSATSGELQVTKTVQSAGEYVLELASGRDRVTIAVTGQGTHVTRGKNHVELRRSGAAPGSADQVRRVLSDSPAVLRYRGMSDALLGADDHTAAGLALIMTDAAVGLLAGDVGAPRRTAEFLARRAKANRRPAGMAIDCFYLMEQRMMEAWNDYSACWISVWPNTIYQDMCAWRWIIQVESYWFGFLSCSGFSW